VEATKGTQEQEPEIPVFKISDRGITAAMGAWHLAWGFFIRNFDRVFGLWLRQGETGTNELLPEIGLILMLSGAVCLFLAAYPVSYRVLFIFVILVWLTVAVLFLTGIFAEHPTKQLFFHVILNYGISSLLALWMLWKAQVASKHL
jgi:hypothetical protein